MIIETKFDIGDEVIDNSEDESLNGTVEYITIRVHSNDPWIVYDIRCFSFVKHGVYESDLELEKE